VSIVDNWIEENTLEFYFSDTPQSVDLCEHLTHKIEMFGEKIFIFFL
jgi:hypothetical protein